jgi:hypothetical protein
VLNSRSTTTKTRSFQGCRGLPCLRSSVKAERRAKYSKMEATRQARPVHGHVACACKHGRTCLQYPNRQYHAPIPHGQQRFFETIHSGEEEQPRQWDELLKLSRFKSDYDFEYYVPELPNEWLSEEERLARELRNNQERAKYLDR